jgi:hypothetical protein
VKEVLGPFKDATLKLESTKTPTAHLAGRVMLWVLYKAPALTVKAGVSRRPFRSGFVNAMREKLATQIDDPALITEWAVAHTLDPRQRAL